MNHAAYLSPDAMSRDAFDIAEVSICTTWPRCRARSRDSPRLSTIQRSVIRAADCGKRNHLMALQSNLPRRCVNRLRRRVIWPCLVLSRPNWMAPIYRESVAQARSLFLNKFFHLIGLLEDANRPWVRRVVVYGKPVLFLFANTTCLPCWPTLVHHSC